MANKGTRVLLAVNSKKLLVNLVVEDALVGIIMLVLVNAQVQDQILIIPNLPAHQESTLAEDNQEGQARLIQDKAVLVLDGMAVGMMLQENMLGEIMGDMIPQAIM